jgi:hypothetical protein
MNTEKIKMESVKFSAAMKEVVPVMNMATVLNIAEGLQCQSSMQVLEQINTCYGPVKSVDKEGKEITVPGLVNQLQYFKVATEVLYQSAASACEKEGRVPDFSRGQIKALLTQTKAANVLMWFMQEVTLLSQAETQAEGNEPATIRITC